MPKFVMVQGGGEGIFLVPEFPDAAAAQAFATDIGVGGVATAEAAFLLSPYSEGVDLEVAKENKQSELQAEGDRRSLLVDPHFTNVEGGYILLLVVNAMTMLGNDWAAVAQAWDDARVVVDALPNVAAVDAYDVVTDPAWP